MNTNNYKKNIVFNNNSKIIKRRKNIILNKGKENMEEKNEYERIPREKIKRGKIILIGSGAVGSTFLYTLIAQNIGREIGVIDLNVKKAEGDVMDLSNACSYNSPKNIYIAEYEDCRDAEIIAIAAGVPQKVGETRMDLLNNNIKVFKNIINEILKSGFNGIFLIATNPVDVLTYATWKISGFPKERVIGTGTSLDTARLRREVAEILNVDTRNVHGYILGEHGDTEFPAWSQTNIGGVNLKTWLEKHGEQSIQSLDKIFLKVKNAAYEIIERKGATYYGIGMSMARICKAILNDESSILPISAPLQGEYGKHDVFIGVPAILNKDGVREVIEIDLDNDEKDKMDISVKAVKTAIKESMHKDDPNYIV